MPTLNIEGRKVKVDDSFLSLSPADQQATVEEIASQLGISSQKPVSGLKDQFLGGLESNTEQPGVSIEAGGKALGLQGVQDTGKWLRDLTSQPKDFVSATDRFIHPQKGDSYVDPVAGFGWGNLPGAATETAGQLTGSLASRGAGAGVGGLVGAAAGPGGAAAGAAVGAVAGPALLGFVSTIGPVALERAKNDGREEPTWEDWAAAAGTAGAVGALESIGIGKLGLLNSTLKNAAKTTTKGIVKETAKDIGKSTVREGAVGTGQSLVQQYGETAGTEKGATLDLKQALGEGIAQGAAGGGLDIVRRARPTYRTLSDSIAIDRAVRNQGEDAKSKAEITVDVNDIANRMSKNGKEPVTQEVNRYVSDLRRQIAEAIDGQNIPGEDKKALKGGMTDATGLTQDRLNEIAGRSDSPDEIKALARKVQLVREMVVQKQGRKGIRGWMALGTSTAGGAAGAYAGSLLPVLGPIGGAALGQNIGRDIARRLRSSQTQGQQIESLVGKTQARRAQMLLDRYGPSDATKALNTLTERAASNKAQAEAEAQARQDFADTMAKIRDWQSMRQKSLKAEEQAQTREEKAKVQAERKQQDLAYREIRLKAMALKAANTEARNQRLVQDLEHKKSMNALTVEMTQVRKDLQQKLAEAKAGSLDRQKQFEIDNLRGRMEMLRLDISKRQEALKKAEIATKRAQKLSEVAPKAAGPVLSRIRSMGAKWAQSVENDSNIVNKPAYQSATQYLDTLRQEAQNEIKGEPNSDTRNLLRETLTDLLSLKNNWEARRERFARAMMKAKEIGGDAPQKLRDVLYQLAHYKAPEGGTEDFGSTNTPQDS